MKFKHYLTILSTMLIAILVLGVGCLAPPVTETSIIISNGDAVTNDATPTLTISAVGAVYMAFSGNGTTWSEWVEYATTYNLFNITTGAGCSTSEGTKTIYAKFKNAAGTEVGECHDSIEYDITGPKLTSAVYSDAKNKGSGTVNKGDIITFTFDDEMKTSTITDANLSSRVPLSSSSYGSGATVSWSTNEKVCTVTLGTSPDIPYGTTVNPTLLVTDAAGNSDNSSDVTISGLPTTSALASVTISPPSASTTEGGDNVNFTAAAKDGAGNDITGLCTFTWSITGTAGGSITSSTNTAVYTPPSSGTGDDTVKVTAKYELVTETDTAPVAVTESTPCDRLFVSAQKGEAKYTSLPEGATVVVYSWATNDAVAAHDGGPKATIDSLANPAIYIGGDNDWIFFEMTDPDPVIPLTADGRLPDAPPNLAALTKIQATSETTVTSTTAGNVGPNDKITLYVDGIAYSEPTLVGETMTLSKHLVAGEQPKYTRTNTDGHESITSLEDGIILQLLGALTSNETGIEDMLDEGDLVTFDFGGSVSVDVLSPIQVSNISWVASASTAALDDGTETLANTGTNLTTVTLCATANYTDFATGEWVEFNILPDTLIVDHIGGNQVLPADPVFTYHATDF